MHSLQSLPFEPKQILISKSRKGTIRGLHKSPYAKYIYVIDGEILDFYVDPTHGETEVNLKQGSSVLIPENSPHGFYAVEDATIMYLLAGYYTESTDQVIHWKTPEYTFQTIHALSEPLILSAKDSSASYSRKYDVVLLGANGFLGSHALKHLSDAGLHVLSINTRLCNTKEIMQHVQRANCGYVVCAAGISGRPTIDWCDTHEYETWQTNYLDMLNLMHACKECDVHLTIFGSGLVYKTESDNAVFSEDDEPNFDEKVYTRYRILLESATKLYPNVLYLRILYPTSFDGHEKCFMTKLRGRSSNVHNVSVPLTVVPSLFPHLASMLTTNATGIYNFVNEGVISLPHLLDIANQPYKISMESTSKRGDYSLDVSKLRTCIKDVQHVTSAVATYMT